MVVISIIGILMYNIQKLFLTEPLRFMCYYILTKLKFDDTNVNTTL